MKKIITLLLNEYLFKREQEKLAKADKERLRDNILSHLAPTSANEWLVPGWGRVTYKTPEPSLKVDLAKLAKRYPLAYKKCVVAVPNEARFCVYPEMNTLVEVMGEKETSLHP